MPQADANPIPKRRHPEWQDHQIRWRWLLDSYEGGEAYRLAVYGVDSRGFQVRNLVRHKREYPDTGSGDASAYLPQAGDDPYAATTDDYTLRLARTPVPRFLSEVVETHLSGIYSQEVERDTPHAGLAAWWDDVDGHGTTADEWWANTVAPLLMVFGCLDLQFDHPQAPPGEDVVTRADEIRLGLGRVVASYVLPENVVDWELNADGRSYAWCVVKEHREDGCVYRHWTDAGWTLYDEDGKVLGTGTHPFGRVPIVRVFDRRRPRCRHVGLPRYEGVAEKQREYYNRDSELILSDTTQAHPLIQGPEDYVQADGTIPVGPSWLLPKKMNNVGGMASYEGFEIIEFPKAGADSIRQNLDRLREAVDREALLTKPAGSAGTGKDTVSQSGVSKRIDQAGGSKLLAKIAGALQKAETQAAEMALLVLGDGVIDRAALAATAVTYPRSFDLMDASELAAATAGFQAVLAAAGACPETEGDLIGRLVREILPGLGDDEYDEMDAEIAAYLADRAAQRKQAEQAAQQALLNPTPAGAPAASSSEPTSGNQPAAGAAAGGADAGAGLDDSTGQGV